jgi:HNH endonuclease
MSRKIIDPLHFISLYNRKVIKSNGCWTWNGNKDKDGYSIFGFRKKTLKAHRISWQIHKKEKIDGISVLHKCDNRECTNPDHLFLGMAKDNILDMIKKGRRVAAKGEKHSRAKLNNQNVIEIRNLVQKGLTHRAIAKMFNVDNTLIRDIKSRKIWGHLNG